MVDPKPLSSLPTSREEVIARAMCKADGFDPLENMTISESGAVVPRWYFYVGEARRFLAAQSVFHKLKTGQPIEDDI